MTETAERSRRSGEAKVGNGGTATQLEGEAGVAGRRRNATLETAKAVVARGRWKDRRSKQEN